MDLNKIFSAVYNENDFGRGIATTLGGIAGLITYLSTKDVAISAFAAIIIFPVTRIITELTLNKIRMTDEDRKNKNLIMSLSESEKQILDFFVQAGGASVSWGYVNNSDLPFPRPALNSLIERGLIRTSVMEDGMTESFVLDTNIFDLANRYLKLSACSNA